MSLLDSMMSKCTMIDKRTVSDGVFGVIEQWVDGASFEATIIKDTTTEARLAEKQGVSEVYTVVVHKNVPLRYHDVIRRESDQAIFRITSNIADSEAPDASSVKIGKVSAERWALT